MKPFFWPSPVARCPGLIFPLKPRQHRHDEYRSNTVKSVHNDIERVTLSRQYNDTATSPAWSAWGFGHNISCHPFRLIRGRRAISARDADHRGPCAGRRKSGESLRSLLLPSFNLIEYLIIFELLAQRASAYLSCRIIDPPLNHHQFVLGSPSGSIAKDSLLGRRLWIEHWHRRRRGALAATGFTQHQAGQAS